MAGSPESSKPGAASKLDVATIGGLVLALVAILGGLTLEGGSVRDVSQITAALIVLGGTLGAVMVSTPMPILMGAAKQSLELFKEPVHDPSALIEKIVLFAVRARKHGIVSLENEAAELPDPFLRKALNLAIDGTDLNELRHILELDIEQAEARLEALAKVFENAGGYAPTIGIIGAVLGLIQVMKHLEDIKEVGHGIAVAFVATVYGVGLANLVLLPAAGKIRIRTQAETQTRELIVEGVIGIVEGLNPKLIRQKLDAYLPGTATQAVREQSSKAAAA